MSAHPPLAGGFNAAETIKDIAGKITGRPSRNAQLLFGLLVLVGVASFAGLMLTGNPVRAWGAYLVNAVYWTGIAAGGATLASAIRLANGRWGHGAVRLAESLGSFLPLAMALLLVVFLFGATVVLPWVRQPIPAKAAYLNLPFLFVRTFAGFALLWWLRRAIVRTSMRTDAYLLKDHVTSELRPYYEKLSAGWRGNDAEEAWQRDRLSKLSPGYVAAYAAVFTLFAWDWVMSLDPHWTSTLFGWWMFMGAFLCAIATTAILLARVRATHRLEAYIGTQQFWDMGKIVFAVSTFWLYQFWSQYLVIWYGNLPEETNFVFIRFQAPWRTLTWTVGYMVWLIPFLGLLNSHTKKNPVTLSLFSLCVLVGMWLERFILVMPSLKRSAMILHAPELGVTLGFLGLFGFAVQNFLSRHPAVRVADVLAHAELPEH